VFQSSQMPLSFRRTCRDLLASLGTSGPTTVIGFISAVRKEGVSTVCVCMAQILAATDRVLLVDAGLGGRPATALLNIETPSSTKNGPPLGQDDIIIVQSTKSGIDVLTLDPSEMGTHFAKILAEVQSQATPRYRFVIVDLGSLQSLISPAWAEILHRTYVVVDTSRTSGELLANARRELDTLKFPVAGAVMNREQPSVASYFERNRT
jgi:Mrp family chromosome partitioning ATPase